MENENRYFLLVFSSDKNPYTRETVLRGRCYPVSQVRFSKRMPYRRVDKTISDMALKGCPVPKRLLTDLYVKSSSELIRDSFVNDRTGISEPFELVPNGMLARLREDRDRAKKKLARMEAQMALPWYKKIFRRNRG